MYRFLFSIFCLMLSAPVMAERDRYGASDYPGVERFPQSHIVEYRDGEVPEYRVILGGLEKVNGVIRPEREARMKGVVTRITYQMPGDHDSLEPFVFFKQQLSGEGAEVLFECHGRECGSSSYWANHIFSMSRLYGPDPGQHYLALSRGAETFVLYTVKRGNKRVYAHLEVLQKNTEGADFTAALSDQSFALLTDLDTQLPQLLALMQQNPATTAWLVGFDRQADDAELAFAQSRALAEAARDRLLALEADPQRLRVFPAGAMLPMVAVEAASGVYVVLK